MASSVSREKNRQHWQRESGAHYAMSKAASGSAMASELGSILVSSASIVFT
jgi:hypothetical protein